MGPYIFSKATRSFSSLRYLRIEACGFGLLIRRRCTCVLLFARDTAHSKFFQKAGHQHIDHPPATSATVKTVSYRDPPTSSALHDSSGVVSIPLGPSMAIFDQVRIPRLRTEHAGGPSKRHSLASTSTKSSAQQIHIRQPPSSASGAVSGMSSSSRGAMSRGHTMTLSKSVQLDQLQWIKSIKREERKDGSRSGTESGPNSRVGSRSRNASREQYGRKGREKSGSGSRDNREEDGSQTWQDE